MLTLVRFDYLHALTQIDSLDSLTDLYISEVGRDGLLWVEDTDSRNGIRVTRSGRRSVCLATDPLGCKNKMYQVCDQDYIWIAGKIRIQYRMRTLWIYSVSIFRPAANPSSYSTRQLCSAVCVLHDDVWFRLHSGWPTF